MKRKILPQKTSEKCISVKMRCSKLWDSFRLLDSTSDKTSRTLTSSLNLDAKGTEKELFRKNLAYRNGKIQTIESIYKPLK